ncbi:MAG: hypothetical protein P8075_10820 [Deltaproteobacteria bacterium]|jgi:hypothetical protein
MSEQSEKHRMMVGALKLLGKSVCYNCEMYGVVYDHIGWPEHECFGDLVKYPTCFRGGPEVDPKSVPPNPT